MATTALLLAASLAAGEPMTAEIVRDRLTDRVSATATLRAGDDRLDIGCTPREPRRAWVRLRSHRWFRDGNALNGNIRFDHRFDAQPARRMQWSVRERTAMLIGRHRVRTFVRQLVGANQLVIRAPGPEGRRYDMIFEIDGAMAAVSRAFDACGDPLLRESGRWDWRLRLPPFRRTRPRL
jgi:hypothetical protein